MDKDHWTVGGNSHPRFDVRTLNPGELIYAWWDSGAGGAEPMIRRVIRVNQVTVTCERTDGTDRGRMPFAQIAGRWTEEA